MRKLLLKGAGWGVQRSSLLLGLLFLIQYALFMGLASPQYDAISYYVQGRSIAFDGDLHLANDYILSYETAAPGYVARDRHLNLTESGRVVIPYALGSGLVWLPLMVTLRLLALPLAGSVDGFEWLFSGTVGAFSALLGLLAFLLAWCCAGQFGSRRQSVLSAALFMFATPLLYYQFREPLYAHATTAFLTAATVAIWLRQSRRNHSPALFDGLLLGALIGLSALVRWQNLVYLTLPLLATGWRWATLRKRRRDPQLLLYPAAAGAAALLLLSPQLALWRLFYGSWLTVPQGEGFIGWWPAYIVPYLVSPYRGLFAWMPLALPALIGLLWLCRRLPQLGIPLLAVIILQTAVNSSLPDWFGGGGYGPRRASGELAIYVIGYTFLWSRLAERYRGRLQRNRWLGVDSLMIGLGALAGLQQLILLRYGLADRLGGSMVTPAPDFGWEQTSWATFVAQLASRLPLIGRPPSEFISADSFVGLLLQGELRLQMWLPLLLATLFSGAAWALWRRIRVAVPAANARRLQLATAVAALIVLFDLWILRLA